MREACLLGAPLLSLLRAQKVGRERLKGRRAPFNGPSLWIVGASCPSSFDN
jgi:hypothetical protein